MAGLKVPDKKYVGRFRGEPGLETTRVWVDGNEGAPPERVASELAAFEQTLSTSASAGDVVRPSPSATLEYIERRSRQPKSKTRIEAD